MKNIRYVLLIQGLICSGFAAGQDYAADKIPQELTRNSNAVVREEVSELVVNDINSANFKQTLVITILNKEGEDHSDFKHYGDKFRSLKSFSGTLYDREGKQLRKIKKSDLRFTEYSSGLVSDGRIDYYEMYAPSYPYTVKYEYEIAFRKGLMWFPPFQPAGGYNVAVERAVYTVTTPADYVLNIKYPCTEIEPEVSAVKNTMVRSWEISGFEAPSKELYPPRFSNIVPCVLFSPASFSCEGEPGSLATWEELGVWYSRLVENRGSLPDKLIKELEELVAGIEDKKELVKTLYDYLGRTTRYVSIQLGIGGWQPIEARAVYANGFGDCKGLSNYLMNMLRHFGVESHYTVIGMGRRNIYSDFASFSQFNHVILQVPLEDEALWLECTNPELPFGYVHSKIAGNDALVLKGGRGEVVSLPAYADSLQGVESHIDINFRTDQTADMKISRTYKRAYYENVMKFDTWRQQEQVNFVRKGLSVPHAEVRDITFQKEHSSEPSGTVSYTLETRKLGNTAGDRIIVDLHPFPWKTATPLREREYDIYIEDGYQHVDHITFGIPEGLKVEQLPKNTKISNRFGHASGKCTVDGYTVKYTVSICIRRGKYDKTDYPELVALREEYRKMCGARLILQKD